MQSESNHDIRALLSSVCDKLEINVDFRDFQVQFFEQALHGKSGFLRVNICLIFCL